MTEFEPTQQNYRNKALELLSLANVETTTMPACQLIVAKAQALATLAVSEALMSGYSGASVGETLERIKNHG